MPKIEASVILVSVPWAERVPPLTLRLTTTWCRLRSAVLLSGGTSGWATKTKSSLMWFSMRRHSLAGTADGSSWKETAEGQQSSFQGQLGGVASFLCGESKGRGLAVELVDGVSPLGQWSIIWVACSHG